MEENKEVKKEMQPKEMSTEQLKQVLHQMDERGRALFEENNNLRKLVQDMDMSNLFKRLDYLFRIIETDNEYLSKEFKDRCGREIEVLMTEPEETNTDNTQQDK